MVQSAAQTVKGYLDELPKERRAVIAKVRDMIRRNLPAGYEEAMGYGMITYSIPLSRYPETYNGQPLLYVALAAQKNNYAVYLTGSYGDPTRAAKLKAGFKAAGKKLDAGKSCIRFKKLEDLPLDVIAEVAGAVPMKRYIELAKAVRAKKK
jgi:hypothetical protein